jgi:hypothetical protein
MTPAELPADPTAPLPAADTATASTVPSPSQSAAAVGPSATPAKEMRPDIRNPEARAPDARILPQLEYAIDQIAQTRTQQAARPELTLRHHDFGAITMRVEALGNDLRATLSARDPGFVPAIQAALAERAVVTGSETSSGQSHNPSPGQRGNDPNGGQSGSSGQGWQSDPRYGSSPGSGQGTYQPYRGQTGSQDEDTVSPQRNATGRSAVDGSDRPGDRDLFA